MTVGSQSLARTKETSRLSRYCLDDLSGSQSLARTKETSRLSRYCLDDCRVSSLSPVVRKRPVFPVLPRSKETSRLSQRSRKDHAPNPAVILTVSSVGGLPECASLCFIEVLTIVALCSLLSSSKNYDFPFLTRRT